MVLAFNPDSCGCVWVQPGLQSEFQDSQGYTEKPLCVAHEQTNKKTHQNKKSGMYVFCVDSKYKRKYVILNVLFFNMMICNYSHFCENSIIMLFVAE